MSLLNTFKNTLKHHITEYETTEQMLHYLGFDDMKEFIEDNWIREISLGLYNGATHTFTRNELDEENIYQAIFTELHETDFYSTAEMIYEDDVEKLYDMKDYNKYDWVIEFLETNEGSIDIFTIKETNEIFLQET